MSHFVLGGTLILLVFSVSALLLVRRSRHRHISGVSTKTVATNPPAPVREFYMDSDGFSLLGPAWKWIRNVPIDYGCPTCGQRVETVFREYRHIPSGYTFSILRHRCIETQETRPLAMVKKEAQ